ncbi:MAG: DUF502 domain-containing protein [Proteobacteria bacterium]|nr:DUF502 domain-containing protein [Pseudomonadota bacterium]
MSSPTMKSMKRKIKGTFLAGIAVIIPIGLTVYILIFMINLMDNLLKIIPHRFQPDELLPFHIPGLGVIFTLIMIFVIGLITKSYLGNKLVGLGEWFVHRIPFVRGVYQATKQLVDTIFSDKSQSFKKVVIVEYPRKGMYVIAFVTGEAKGEVQTKTAKKCINLFVPTTPNPTSGFYIMVPEDDVIRMDMTVEEAFKLVISGGIVAPTEQKGANFKLRKN